MGNNWIHTQIIDMIHTYLKSEPQLWTVGYYDPQGQWIPLQDFDTQQQAQAKVNYLNGGSDPNMTIEKIGTYCKAFFYWWYNQKGTNTDQGFNQWKDTDDFKRLHKNVN